MLAILRQVKLMMRQVTGSDRGRGAPGRGGRGGDNAGRTSVTGRGQRGRGGG